MTERTRYELTDYRAVDGIEEDTRTIFSSNDREEIVTEFKRLRDRRMWNENGTDERIMLWDRQEARMLAHLVIIQEKQWDAERDKREEEESARAAATKEGNKR